MDIGSFYQMQYASFTRDLQNDSVKERNTGRDVDVETSETKNLEKMLNSNIAQLDSNCI